MTEATLYILNNYGDCIIITLLSLIVLEYQGNKQYLITTIQVSKICRKPFQFAFNSFLVLKYGKTAKSHSSHCWSIWSMEWAVSKWASWIITLANHRWHRKSSEPIKTQSNYILLGRRVGKHTCTCTLYACQVSYKWINLICFSFLLDDQVLQVFLRKSLSTVKHKTKENALWRYYFGQ